MILKSLIPLPDILMALSPCLVGVWAAIIGGLNGNLDRKRS